MSDNLEGYLLDCNTKENDDMEFWLSRQKAVDRAAEIVGKLYESSKLIIKMIIEENYLNEIEGDQRSVRRAIIYGHNGQCTIYRLKLNH